MNLTEIYAKLPITYTNVLDKYLDEAELTVGPSRDDIVYAAEDAVLKTKQQLGTILLEDSKLLDEVPGAVADMLVS